MKDSLGIMYRIMDILSLSNVADIITVATLIYAIFYALIFKNKSVIGSFIAKFLVNLLRLSLLIFIGTLIFNIFKETAYPRLILFFKGYEGNIYFSYLICISSYLICGAVFLVIMWMIGTVIWTSSFNGIKSFLNLLLPHNKQFSIEHFKKLHIIKATYGHSSNYFDVTEKIISMIVGNKLTITASNDIGGDPIFGKVKLLKIDYQYDDEERKIIEIPERTTQVIKPE